VGVDDADDLARAAASLTRLGVPQELRGTQLEAAEPVTGVQVTLEVARRTPSFLHPDDLAAMMTGAHSAR
jgi:hypothetical protein